MTVLEKVLQRIDKEMPASVERLFALLRIESISTDPAYARSCREAAEWLVRDLGDIGFDASLRATPGHPIVVAHDRGGPERPHVLFYGHYDVQPVDPLDLWSAPPFEPRLVIMPDGSKQIRARGSADDKGQLMTFVEAARAWKAEGGLPVKVSILLEGEEECGSTNLAPFLADNAAELRSEVALVCDTGMWRRDWPAITIMLRGLVGEEVIVTAADRDLHSGMFGGAARNPIHVLAAVLAALHDETGRVTRPRLLRWRRRAAARSSRSNGSISASTTGSSSARSGCRYPAGEAGRSALEQIWARPTCEVNGIIGGYTGAGFKTVIPSKASAKVSFRLVGDQQPKAIADAFRDFVRARIPADCKVEFISHNGSPAIRLPVDGPWVASARAALKDEWGREPALVGGGGSIPVVGDFGKHSRDGFVDGRLRQ